MAGRITVQKQVESKDTNIKYLQIILSCGVDVLPIDISFTTQDSWRTPLYIFALICG